MNTETMSLRKALGQKKLLDKQIKAMMSEKLAYRTKSVCGFFKLIPINWKFRGHMELIPDNGIAPLG